MAKDSRIEWALLPVGKRDHGSAVNPRHTPLPASTGMVARHPPELVADMDRNTHTSRAASRGRSVRFPKRIRSAHQLERSEIRSRLLGVRSRFGSLCTLAAAHHQRKQSLAMLRALHIPWTGFWCNGGHSLNWQLLI
jgi:hypothetical protein